MTLIGSGGHAARHVASMPTSADCGVHAIENFVAADVGMAPSIAQAESLHHNQAAWRISAIRRVIWKALPGGRAPRTIRLAAGVTMEAIRLGSETPPALIARTR